MQYHLPYLILFRQSVEINWQIVVKINFDAVVLDIDDVLLDRPTGTSEVEQLIMPWRISSSDALH